MGIPSEMRDMWVQKRKGFVIASPAEDQKILRARNCTREGVREGFKAASIACVASAIPTVIFVENEVIGTPVSLGTNGSKILLVAVRMIPWAKANLNYTAQALIISGASIAAYFITADKTILACARRNSQLENALKSQT